MSEMIRRLLRQKFHSPAMVVALSVIALLTAVQSAVTGVQSALEGSVLALLLLSAGSVSKDVSGGALQMILSRPIRRAEYLFGRYFGILVAYALYLASTAALAFVTVELLPRLFGSHPPAGFPANAGRGVATALLNATLLAAIVLFFSTFLRGYGDVLAYFLLLLLLSLPEAVGGVAESLRKLWIMKGLRVGKENLLPQVPWADVLRGEHVFRAETGQYVLAVALFLTLATVVFSRREFSYGHE